MPVVASLEFDYAISSGVAPCNPDGTHRRFCPRTDQSDLLDRWQQSAQQLRYFQFGLGGRAKGQATASGCLYGFNYRRIGYFGPAMSLKL